MEKKKIILTILVAAFLALIAVLFIFKQNSTIQEKQTPVQEEQVEENQNIGTEQPTETKEEKPALKVQSTDKKQSVKISTTPAQKEVNQKEPIIKEIQVTKNAEVEEESKDVVIPVKYSSRNTFKYVYTPTRFTKQK